MKRTLLTIFCFVSFFAQAQIDTLLLESEITDVQVFFQGAEIQRKANLDLAKGEYYLKIQGLPIELNEKSVQVKGIDDCTILSVKHQMDANENKSEEIVALEDKIEQLEIQIKHLVNEYNVYNVEEQVLLNNSVLSGKDKGISVPELKELSSFYRTNFNEIAKAKIALQIEIDDKKEAINDFYKKINKLSAATKNTSEVLIHMSCERFIKDELKLSYYIATAGWDPTYDFRVDDVDKPLAIDYNANIYQSSGEDWEEVNITLSTGNPNLSNDKPEMKRWILGDELNYEEQSQKGIGSLRIFVYEMETEESIPMANVVLEKDNKVIAGAVADFDGLAIIKPVESGYYTMKVSFIGFSTYELRLKISGGRETKVNVPLRAESAVLGEIELVEYVVPLIDADKTGVTYTREDITAIPTRNVHRVAAQTAGVYRKDNAESLNVRGSRGNDTYYYIDGVKVRQREYEEENLVSNTLQEKVSHLNYMIDVPYTLLSDGKDQKLQIKRVKLPVDYIYEAMPVVNSEVYVSAKIPHWDELNLLSGNTSIYYQGTFVGESYLDTESTQDTLSVALGRDQQIKVTREGQKEKYDKHYSGSYVKETIAWELTVKNVRNKSIKVKLYDQIPVSERKSRTVELLSSSEAKLFKREGFLEWEMDLLPQETKKVNFEYLVRYPKTQKITY